MRLDVFFGAHDAPGRDVVVASYVNLTAVLALLRTALVAASLIDRKYGDNLMRLFLTKIGPELGR